MKRPFIVIAFTAAILDVLLVLSLPVWAQPIPGAVTAPSSYATLLGVPKTMNLMELPNCFDAECKAKVYRVDVQVKTPAWLLVDVYASFKGASHFAHVFRLQTATHWVWVVVAQDLFFHRALKVWANGKAGLVGPAPVEYLPLKPTVCAQVAPMILVNATTDAGTLRQPNPSTTVSCPNGPRDGGVPDCKFSTTVTAWPPTKVLTCRDGGGPYYLKQLKYGGQWVNGWTSDVDGGMPTTGAAPRLEPRVPTGWGWAPDARVTKTCPPVPINATCP